MIPYQEMREINRKLSIMIWINVISFIALLIGLVVVAALGHYWFIGVIVAIGVIHSLISYWLFRKLRKHTRMW